MCRYPFLLLLLALNASNPFGPQPFAEEDDEDDEDDDEDDCDEEEEEKRLLAYVNEEEGLAPPYELTEQEKRDADEASEGAREGMEEGGGWRG